MSVSSLCFPLPPAKTRDYSESWSQTVDRIIWPAKKGADSTGCNNQTDSNLTYYSLHLIIKGLPENLVPQRLRDCDACQRLTTFKGTVPNGCHRPRMFGKDLQSAKAPSPMAVTDSGIVMFAKDSQPSKAKSPISVTDSGIVMLAKDSQPAKAPSPMAVTDSGIVMLAKDLQSKKA